MIKIGIDATAIPSLRAGAGIYIFNLVKVLAKIDNENEYVVFAKPEHVLEWNITNKNFIFIPFYIKSRPLRLLWEQCILPFQIRKYKISVFHSPHYTIPLFLPCQSVVTFHDASLLLFPHIHTKVKAWFFGKMIRIVSKRSDCIIAVSQSTKNDFEKVCALASSKVKVIHEAVDASFHPSLDTLRIAQICKKYHVQEKNFLLYVGILEPRKNIPLLINAYMILCEQGVTMPLVIVGKHGWMYDEVFATVKKLNLQDKVIFTGYVSDDDLPWLYNGAKLFVYPSLYEGFGLPVLEAMSCGTPVVTSNISSLPEITGEAAIRINPLQILELSNAMGRIIRDQSLCDALRVAGIAQSTFFSWEKTARETLAVYLQVSKKTQ